MAVIVILRRIRFKVWQTWYLLNYRTAPDEPAAFMIGMPAHRNAFQILRYRWRGFWILALAAHWRREPFYRVQGIWRISRMMEVATRLQ